MFKFGDSPLALGDLFVASFQAYRQAFSQIVVWGFLLAVLKVGQQFLIPINIAQVLNQGNWVTPGLFILSMVVLGVINIILLVSLIYQFFHVMADTPKSFMQALQAGLYRGVKIILGAFIVVLILLVIICGLGWLLFKLNEWLAIGFMLFAFIYSWIVLFAWLPLVAIENGSVAAAVKESFYLVKGHFWQTASVLTIGMIIISALTLILATVFGGAYISIAGVTSATGTNWGVVAAGFCVDVVVLPWFLGLTIVLIHNLRLHHEQHQSINK